MPPNINGIVKDNVNGVSIPSKKVPGYLVHTIDFQIENIECQELLTVHAE